MPFMERGCYYHPKMAYQYGWVGRVYTLSQNNYLRNIHSSIQDLKEPVFSNQSPNESPVQV